MLDFSLTFPPGFLWGTATAAHQVEGHSAPSNWTAWEGSPDHVYEGQASGAACDWWEGGRYEEDFERAAALHTNAHRLSLAWERIEPQPGRYDEAALQRYAEMLAALRARGLEPFVTLHHFTHPLWLEEQGGWANPAAVGHFADYARVVAEALGDRVSMWCTLNEPLVFATQGYLLGRFPPGKRRLRLTFRVAENLLRGHAAAYHAIKQARPNAHVGLAKHQVSLVPRRPSWLHRPALRLLRQTFNRAFVDALLSGELRFPGYRVSVTEARDTLDWLGLNTYYRFQVGFHPLRPRQFFIEQSAPREGLLGPEGVGEIWPEGLLEQVKWLAQRTDKPLYVTGNGVPAADDALRRLFIVRSVRSLWHAINFNYPVKGYFFYSLIDSFEWAEGYDPQYRFGLYGCDPQTQARTRRRSAELYREVCAANALTAETVRRYLPDEFAMLFPAPSVQREVTLPPRLR